MRTASVAGELWKEASPRYPGLVCVAGGDESADVHVALDAGARDPGDAITGSTRAPYSPRVAESVVERVSSVSSQSTSNERIARSTAFAAFFIFRSTSVGGAYPSASGSDARRFFLSPEGSSFLRGVTSPPTASSYPGRSTGGSNATDRRVIGTGRSTGAANASRTGAWVCFANENGPDAARADGVGSSRSS